MKQWWYQWSPRISEIRALDKRRLVRVATNPDVPISK